MSFCCCWGQVLAALDEFADAESKAEQKRHSQREKGPSTVTAGADYWGESRPLATPALHLASSPSPCFLERCCRSSRADAWIAKVETADARCEVATLTLVSASGHERSADSRCCELCESFRWYLRVVEQVSGFGRSMVFWKSPGPFASTLELSIVRIGHTGNGRDTSGKRNTNIYCRWGQASAPFASLDEERAVATFHTNAFDDRDDADPLRQVAHAFAVASVLTYEASRSLYLALFFQAGFPTRTSLLDLSSLCAIKRPVCVF